MWESFRHPIVLIAPTVGALVGCCLGYVAASRKRWLTTSALLVAFIVGASWVTAWLYGATAYEYKREVFAAVFALTAPTALPYLMALTVSLTVDDIKSRARALLSLEVVAGLLGVLVYPVWAILCGCWVFHDCL